MHFILQNLTRTFLNGPFLKLQTLSMQTHAHTKTHSQGPFTFRRSSFLRFISVEFQHRKFFFCPFSSDSYFMQPSRGSLIWSWNICLDNFATLEKREDDLRSMKKVQGLPFPPAPRGPPAGLKTLLCRNRVCKWDAMSMTEQVRLLCWLGNYVPSLGDCLTEFNHRYVEVQGLF